MGLNKRQGIYTRLSTRKNCPRNTGAGYHIVAARPRLYWQWQQSGHRKLMGRNVMDHRDTERLKQRLGWQASQSWKSFQNIADSKHGDPLYALQELMWLLYGSFLFLPRSALMVIVSAWKIVLAYPSWCMHGIDYYKCYHPMFSYIPLRAIWTSSNKSIAISCSLAQLRQCYARIGLGIYRQNSSPPPPFKLRPPNA